MINHTQFSNPPTPVWCPQPPQSHNQGVTFSQLDPQSCPLYSLEKKKKERENIKMTPSFGFVFLQVGGGEARMQFGLAVTTESWSLRFGQSGPSIPRCWGTNHNGLFFFIHGCNSIQEGQFTKLQELFKATRAIPPAILSNSICIYRVHSKHFIAPSCQIYSPVHSLRWVRPGIWRRRGTNQLTDVNSISCHRTTINNNKC